MAVFPSLCIDTSSSEMEPPQWNSHGDVRKIDNWNEIVYTIISNVKRAYVQLPFN